MEKVIIHTGHHFQLILFRLVHARGSEFLFCLFVNYFPFRASCSQMAPIHIPVVFVQHAAFCSVCLAETCGSVSCVPFEASSIAWLLLKLQCVCKEACSLFSSKDVAEIKLAY